MTRYNTFLFLFILSTIATAVFLVFYIQAIFGIAFNEHDLSYSRHMPFEFLGRIFSTQVVLSLLVAGITSLAYRILGIVIVARNKSVSDGEKALWIIGFVIMSFITAIVFLILAKSRKFVNESNN